MTHIPDVSEDPWPKRRRLDYTCAKCQASYTEKRSLTRHRRTSACGYDADEHIPIHTCTFCELSFSRDDIRQRHEKEIHFSIKRPPPTRRARLSQSSTFSGEEEGPSLDTVVFGFGNLSDQPRLLATIEEESSMNIIEQSYQLRDERVGIATSYIQEDPEAETSDFEMPNCEDAVQSDQSAESASVTSSEPYTPSTDEFMDVCGRPFNSSESQTSLLDNRSFDLPVRSRTELIKSGANPRKKTQKISRPCALCHKPLGTTNADIEDHLRRHAEELQGEHECDTCQITFVHLEDLHRHTLLAEKEGYCGFGFDHTRPCSGHHPPCAEKSAWSDNDRARLSNQLRHWEQAQLQAYISSIDELLNANSQKDSDHWSIGALFRSSTWSLPSVLSGVSTPSYIDYGEKLNLAPIRANFWRATFLGTRNRSAKLTPPPVSDPPTVIDHIDHALIEAVIKVDVSKARRLISEGADVNARRLVPTGGSEWFTPSPGQHSAVSARVTPLHAAALGRSLEEGKIAEIVDLLVAEGAAVDRNVMDTYFGTPLCTAAATGNTTVIGSLLKHGAYIDGVGSGTKMPLSTALCVAAACGSAPAVHLLLAAGANPEIISRPSSQHPWAMGSALYWAVLLGHGCLVDEFARFGIAQGSLDCLLAMTIQQHHPKGFKALIKYATNQTIQKHMSIALNAYYEMPSHVDRDVHFLKILIHCGAYQLDQFLSDGVNAGQQLLDDCLSAAAEVGNIAAAEVLIRHGANVNAENVLSRAVHHWREGMVRLLFEHGALPTPIPVPTWDTRLQL